MYKICRTEQSFKRQRTIENGLLELMLKHRFEDISISDLCAHLHIPRKTFYRYFSGKDGALYALLDHTMMDFQLSESDVIHTQHGLRSLDRFFSFWYERQALLSALGRSSLNGILVERATHFALQEKMMPRYMLSWEPDLQSIALSFAISGLMSMVIQWHNQKYMRSAQEMTRIALDMLTRPLLSTQ